MGIATLQKIEQMGYVNLYRQTKVANVSNEEGERLGFRTTTLTKPAIIVFGMWLSTEITGLTLVIGVNFSFILADTTIMPS